MSTCHRCGQRTTGRLCQACRLDERDYSGTCAVCGADVQYVSICDECSETAAAARDDDTTDIDRPRDTARGA